jgi:hypothetical protein|tara:strand:- start:170 stop:661 length:492 start_codon:yes stop_codon:yes gene_type:complete
MLVFPNSHVHKVGTLSWDMRLATERWRLDGALYPHLVSRLQRRSLLAVLLTFQRLYSLGRLDTQLNYGSLLDPCTRALCFTSGTWFARTASSGGLKAKRRVVVFFLVNPEKRIVSTHEVSPQQERAGGEMTFEKALQHRLELMEERKYTKQDWNVREIELCEH